MLTCLNIIVNLTAAEIKNLYCVCGIYIDKWYWPICVLFFYIQVCLKYVWKNSSFLSSFLVENLINMCKGFFVKLYLDFMSSNSMFALFCFLIISFAAIIIIIWRYVTIKYIAKCYFKKVCTLQGQHSYIFCLSCWQFWQIFI